MTWRRKVALSLAVTYWLSAVAFFSLPTRAWQLAAGGLVALTAGQWRRLPATFAAIAGWAGLFFASPVVLWQVWRFVTPGLHPKEKRYAIPFIVSSILLFSLGGLVAMLTFPQALHFLIYVGGNSLRTFFSPSKYLRLIMLMILAFGIAFEFPVVLVSLEVAGVLTSAKLRSWRRWAFLSIFVVAAVITPSADPFSMFAMAVPMYVFYEGAIVVGRLLKH